MHVMLIGSNLTTAGIYGLPPPKFLEYPRCQQCISVASSLYCPVFMPGCPSTLLFFPQNCGCSKHSEGRMLSPDCRSLAEWLLTQLTLLLFRKRLVRVQNGHLVTENWVIVRSGKRSWTNFSSAAEAVQVGKRRCVEQRLESVSEGDACAH